MYDLKKKIDRLFKNELCVFLHIIWPLSWMYRYIHRQVQKVFILNRLLTKLPSLTTARWYHTCAVVTRYHQSNLVVIGGTNSAYASITSTEFYNLVVRPTTWVIDGMSENNQIIQRQTVLIDCSLPTWDFLQTLKLVLRKCFSANSFKRFIKSAIKLVL